MPATVEDRPRSVPESRSVAPLPGPPISVRLGTSAPDWSALRRYAMRRLSPVVAVQATIVAIAVGAAIWAIHHFGRHYTFFDLKIYHGAMVWWTHGGDLYDFVAPKTTLGFTYPPFAALVMAPMAMLPTIAAGWMNTVLSLAGLSLLLSWLLVPVADRCGWPRWFAVAVAVPLAAATEPIRETLGFGQINLLLAVLIYADFVALRNRAQVSIESGPDGPPERIARLGAARRLWDAGTLAGLGVGLATAIKLTPGVFIIYFLVTRQWRAALVSAGTTVGVTLVTFMVTGRAAGAYFGSVVFDTSRVGAVDSTANQSLAGVLARLYDSPTTPTVMWLAFAALLLAVGMTRAINAHNVGDELTAFTIVGLTGNAICPISWSHHLVFLIPALVVLGDSALRHRRAARGLAPRGMWSRGPTGIPALAGLGRAAAALAVYLLFVVSPIWMYEHKLPNHSHYADGLHGAFWENSLGLAIIALIVLLPARAGADPAFYQEPALARRRALLSR
jgi:alpha-1,2-mannosyltransferase